MTNNEADFIIDKIYAGGKFSTRFQEESWGFYLKDGVIKYWSERLNEDGSETKINEDWTREKLQSLLTSTYSFAIINERTRFEKLIVDGREFDINITHFAFPEALPQISNMQELAKLPFFPKLTSASFTESNLNGSGLTWVCDCTLLENLNLQATKISDDDLVSLHKCAHLKILRLKDNLQLTDKAIDYLASMSSLEDLQIQETSISEAGVSRLTPLRGLRQIVLSMGDGRLTKEGLTAASKNLPDCTIVVKGAGEFLAGEFSGSWE